MNRIEIERYVWTWSTWEGVKMRDKRLIFQNFPAFWLSAVIKNVTPKQKRFDSVVGRCLFILQSVIY